MTFGLIAFIILLLAGVVTTLVWGSTKGKKDSYNTFRLSGWVPAGVFGLAMLVLLFSCFTMVGTRDIGVVTSFGRPVRHLDNGIHLKAPWEKVSTLDGAIQTDNYVGSKNCTDIRIGNESTACVDNSIRWRINPNAGDELFRDYHTMDNIRDSLVTRELKAALNEALSGYNPLNEIQDSQSGAKPNLNQFAAEVTKSLQKQIGGQIDVLSVIIPIIRFDASTQNKLNSYQQQIAQTRIAQQSIQTAKAEAEANRVLAQSVSKDPNVLVSKCLDMIKGGVNVPTGFSCWPGGGSAVVVPSGSTK